MGDWFINPLGEDPLALFGSGRRQPEPIEVGRYVCDLCGFPLVPCVQCGQLAMCGLSWCELCQPDG